VDGVEVDDVVLALAEHQHRDLVLDLLVAALRPAPPLQELRREVRAGVLVDGAANGGEFAPVNGGWSIEKGGDYYRVVSVLLRPTSNQEPAHTVREPAPNIFHS